MAVVNFEMKQAHWIGRNINDGSSMSLSWEPLINKILLARLTTGISTDEEFTSLPQDQVIIIPRLVNGRVPEVMGNSIGPYIVAPQIKEFLESHEPGIHQFAPMQIRTLKPNDGVTEHGVHWLLRSPPVVDCLIIEGTVFIYDVRGKEWSRDKTDSAPWGGGISSDPENPCLFDASLAQGRHLWRFKVGPNRSDYCCSEKFWNFYKANKMLGWLSEKPCTLR